MVNNSCPEIVVNAFTQQVGYLLYDVEQLNRITILQQNVNIIILAKIANHHHAAHHVQ